MRGIGIIAAGVLLYFTAAGETSPDRLFQAVRNNDLTYLKAQLATGADVNARDGRGNTLLIDAAVFGSPKAVKLLLDAGADVHAKNDFGATALVRAANDPEKARMLVDKGADVNARTKLGRTPLIVAASCDGCSQTVALLLEKGADVKARDSLGITPIDLAADIGDLETVRLLLAKGSEADPADKFGITPLMSAAQNCDEQAVRLLLSKGANANAANTFGGKVKFGDIALKKLTPLMLAAPYCGAGVVKTLLGAGANVNAKDIREMTPLMLAVASETQDLAVVRLLVGADADVNAKSNTGETALDWAKKFNNREVIAALAAAGAREGAPFTPPRRPAVPARTPMQASASGAALLQKTSTEFFNQAGCVSCHSQAATAVAVSAARRAGVHVDDTAGRDQIQMMVAQLAGLRERLLERVDPGGANDEVTAILLAMSAAGYPGDGVTDAAAVYLAARQHRDGSWRLPGISRAPLEEGVIGRTAMAMRALQVYGPPGRKADFERRIARARAWLMEANPATNDDLAMQLLGLYWAGAGGTRIQSLGGRLAAAQRPDGGWAQNRNLASDAYATGESLRALGETGVLKPADAAYRRGVKFLLDTQWSDGSWYVRSRAPKFQPYFQSGFPYDHDQWISSAATAWAVTALAPAAGQ